MRKRYAYQIAFESEEDEKLFLEQCDNIEKKFPYAPKPRRLLDVDGAHVVEYNIDGKNLVVIFDVLTSDVYMWSYFPLTDFFPDKAEQIERGTFDYGFADGD